MKETANQIPDNAIVITVIKKMDGWLLKSVVKCLVERGKHSGSIIVSSISPRILINSIGKGNNFTRGETQQTSP